MKEYRKIHQTILPIILLWKPENFRELVSEDEYSFFGLTVQLSLLVNTKNNWFKRLTKNIQMPMVSRLFRRLSGWWRCLSRFE